MHIPYLPVQNISLETSNKSMSYGYSVTSTSYKSEPTSIKQKILDSVFSKDNVRLLIFWLIIIQILFFCTGKFLAMTSKRKYTCVLYEFGASYTPAVRVLNQYYRLIMPVFLHLNFWHIFFNTLAQITFCWSLEESLKTKMFALVYFATGLGGILLSENASPSVLSVGASSAIYGTFGFELTYVLENYEDLGPRRRNYTVMLIMYVFNGLVHSGEHVDFYGHMGNINRKHCNLSDFLTYLHIGGFLTGLLISFLFLKKSEYFGTSLAKIKIVSIIILIAFYTGLFTRIMFMSGLRNDALGMEYNCDN